MKVDFLGNGHGRLPTREGMKVDFLGKPRLLANENSFLQM